MPDDKWFKRWGKQTPSGPWSYADIEEMMKEMERAFLEAESEASMGLAGDGGDSSEIGHVRYWCSPTFGTDPESVAGFDNSNRRPSKQWRESISDVREPLVEVVDSVGEVRVLAELPGARKKDVQISLHGDELVISARGHARKYRKQLSLPSSVSIPEATFTMNNGVLELILPKRKGGSRGANAAG